MKFNELVRYISKRDEYFYNVVSYARLATIRDLIALGICVFLPYTILCEFVEWGYLFVAFGGLYVFLSCLMYKLRFKRYLTKEEAAYVNRVLTDYGEPVRVRFERTSNKDVVVLDDKYKTPVRLGRSYIPKGRTVRVLRCYQLKGGYRLLRYRYRLLRS